MLTPSVRPRVTRPELGEAARILADAFDDYPMFTRTLPDPVRRAAGLPLMWRALAEQFDRDPLGAVDLAPDPTEDDGDLSPSRMVGATIWGDGTRCDLPLPAAVRYGHLRFALACGLRDALRLSSLQDEINAVHHEIVTEPHLYLLGIGVRRGHRGRGVGSELLRRGHARADEQGLPCYLETNLERDVALYVRHGYVVVRRGVVHGLDTWYLLRPAA